MNPLSRLTTISCWQIVARQKIDSKSNIIVCTATVKAGGTKLTNGDAIKYGVTVVTAMRANALRARIGVLLKILDWFKREAGLLLFLR